jgi:hypothetical protein
MIRIKTSRRHDRAAQFLVRHHALWRRAIVRNRSDKAIATAYHCLQVLRLPNVVSKRTTNLTDRRIDALVHIHEHVLAPKRARYLLASDKLALVFYQKHQQLQGQAFQSHHGTAAQKLKPAEIEFEIVERNLLIRQCVTPTRSSRLNRAVPRKS